MNKSSDTLILFEDDEKAKEAFARAQAAGLSVEYCVEELTPDMLPNTVLQMTGKVVRIEKAVHSRRALGQLQLPAGNASSSPFASHASPSPAAPAQRPKHAIFVPNDFRFPRLLIDSKHCPEMFWKDPAVSSSCLYFLVFHSSTIL